MGIQFFIMLTLSVICALFSTILAVNPGCENLIGNELPAICTDCFNQCTPQWCESVKDVDFIKSVCWKTCFSCEGQSSTDAPAATDAPAETEAPTATDAPLATDAPPATDAPLATDTPSATDAPSVTDFPTANYSVSDSRSHNEYTACVDENTNCPRWAREGYCTSGSGAELMRKHCRKSCNTCGGSNNNGGGNNNGGSNNNVGSCGAQDIRPSVNGYIVGGTEAVPNSWPWAVRLFQNGYQICGGTIINERWVVTAAHCMSNARYSVGVGYHNTWNDKHGYKVDVVKTFVHESYPAVGIHDDIALLKLSRPLKFSTYVQPVCLPPSGLKYNDGQTFVAVGWGRTREGGSSSQELRQVELPLISDRVCQQWVRMSPGKEFCAGFAQGGKDSCQGDSGGGVVFKRNNKWYQGGVVSWGYGCARAKSPGVYTYVSRYVHWINNKIASN